MPWHIQPLDAQPRESFDCGDPALNDFVRKYASQYASRDIGRTYVAVAPNDPRVLGYFTLVAGSIPFANAPPAMKKKLPKHEIPICLLAKFAVDRSAQGQGLGRFLLGSAGDRILTSARDIGLTAVVVDAKSESVVPFYRHFGFEPFEDQPLKLFLRMDSLRKARRRAGP